MISLVLALSGACAQKDELSDGVPARAPVAEWEPVGGSDGFWAALALSIAPGFWFTPFAASFS